MICGMMPQLYTGTLIHLSVARATTRDLLRLRSDAKCAHHCRANGVPGAAAQAGMQDLSPEEKQGWVSCLRGCAGNDRTAQHFLPTDYHMPMWRWLAIFDLS
jgi:hypothetical protein